jgi:hypothetical protein
MRKANPGLVNELSEMDYGAQPPKPIAGGKYLILVPKVDGDGNDIAGVRVPDITIPRGTCGGEGLAKGNCCCSARTFRSQLQRA